MSTNKMSIKEIIEAKKRQMQEQNVESNTGDVETPVDTPQTSTKKEQAVTEIVSDGRTYILIPVAGRTIKVPKDSYGEFLERTAHNNLGKLTDNDIETIASMDLGVTLDQGDDEESMRNVQGAIAGIINETHLAGELIEKEKEKEEEIASKAINKGAVIVGGDNEVITGDGTDYIPDNDIFLDSSRYEDEDDEEVDADKVIEEFEKNEKEEDIKTGAAEIKVNTVTMDPSANISIVPFSGKKLIKQRMNNMTYTKKTPVVAVSSNIYAEVAGFNSKDLLAISNDGQDPYLSERNKLQIVFSKIVSSNMGKFTFDTFLRATSLFDKEAFFFGAFKSTYGDEITIPLKCTSEKCGHSFDYRIHTDDIILSKDYSALGEKAQEIMAMTSPKDIVENADVNKILRKRISTGHIIDVDHPSLYTYLESTIKLISTENELQDAVYATVLDILPFIKAIYVPMYDGDIAKADPKEINYMELTVNPNNTVKVNRSILVEIAKELIMLPSDNLLEVTKAIADRTDSIKSKFEIGLQDVHCPRCKAMTGNGIIPFSVTDLLFLVQLHKATKLNTKKTSTQQ
ncbi:MAG: hypothetical protein ACRCX2_33305 [Paraclostridium sp.]